MIKKISLFIFLLTVKLCTAMDVGTPVSTPTSINQQLLEAVTSDKLGNVQLCLAAGANPNTKDSFGRTSLSWAAIEGNLSILQTLLQVPVIDINTQDNIRLTPLMLACMNENNPCVQELLSRGSLVDLQDYIGRTALILAASQGYINNVTTLLAHRADKTIPDQTGQIPYDYAFNNGHALVVNALLDN
jgi:ankyrin repeat protein